MAKEKIYVPKSSGKLRTWKNSNGEPQETLGISFHVESLIDFVKKNQNSKGWINFDINKRRETSQYGETHSISLNDYKKEEDTEY